MNKLALSKAVVPIVLGVAVVAVGAGAYYVSMRAPAQRPCTLEAKLCPDGSAVGRSGPNCAFAACPPGPTPAPVPVPGDCSGPGGACPNGYVCIEKCGPPVARIDEPPPGYYCATNDVANRPRNCPICLAGNVSISTPEGDVNVRNLGVGMTVWTLDGNGKKIAVPILKIVRTPVPPTHEVTHLVLSDGREAWVSPNHPTTDGRLVGDLKTGDRYDGATVTSADLVPYWDSYTYDLLPDGSTGDYWANGIKLKSTLSR